MVQVQYENHATIPHIIDIPNGVPTMLSGNGLEDLIHSECRARFVTQVAALDNSTEMSYVVCDILVPKSRIVKKVGFFAKLWNNVKGTE